LKGVFKVGENEWTDIKEDFEFGSDKTANQIALMWSKVKQIMLSDLKRVNLLDSEKLASRDEWIIAAIIGLENSSNEMKEGQESASSLYDSTFVSLDSLTQEEKQFLEYKKQIT